MSGHRGVAVLIHGFHLQADEWENVVWGDPSGGTWGRVPAGLRLVLRRRADLIIWGSGGSELAGVKEAQHTFNFAVSRVSVLSELLGLDPDDLKSILGTRSIIDAVSKNTAEEIKQALVVCQDRGLEELFLVSSPTHIARCLQEAQKVKGLSGIDVFGLGCDTCYSGSTASDVVVVEPPHRGDFPCWQTHRYVGAILSLRRQGDDVFEAVLRDFGAMLQARGVVVNWAPIKR